MRTLVVLAGGLSTRFGEEDKAVADVAGTPMIRRVVDRIGPVVREVVINCREAQQPAIEEALAGFAEPVTYAHDRTEDAGPVHGLAVGLDEVETPLTGVVACDMPFADPEIFDLLFSLLAGDVVPSNLDPAPGIVPPNPATGPPYDTAPVAEETSTELPDDQDPTAASFDAAIPYLEDGWYQPTQAVYRTAPARAAAKQALDDDDRKALAPAERLRWLAVPGAALTEYGSLETFENVNTQAELERAESYFTDQATPE